MHVNDQRLLHDMYGVSFFTVQPALIRQDNYDLHFCKSENKFLTSMDTFYRGKLQSSLPLTSPYIESFKIYVYVTSDKNRKQKTCTQVRY